MILQTGGSAFGDTSTRSRPKSAAAANALAIDITPSWFPSGSITLTSLARIILLIFVLFSFFVIAIPAPPQSITDLDLSQQVGPCSHSEREIYNPNQKCKKNLNRRIKALKLHPVSSCCRKTSRVIIDATTLRCGQPSNARNKNEKIFSLLQTLCLIGRFKPNTFKTPCPTASS